MSSGRGTEDCRTEDWALGVCPQSPVLSPFLGPNLVPVFVDQGNGVYRTGAGGVQDQFVLRPLGVHDDRDVSSESWANTSGASPTQSP